MPRGFVYEGESWQPLEYTLADGPVSSIRTTETDPAVGFDGSGVWLTDASGRKLINLDDNGLSLSTDDTDNSFATQSIVQWLGKTIAPGQQLGYLFGYNNGLIGSEEMGGTMMSGHGNPAPSEFHVEGAKWNADGSMGFLGRIWAVMQTALHSNTVLDILDADGYSSFVFNGNTAVAPARPGPMKIRIGTGTTTWSGSNASNVLTVNHGLGRTPTVVLITPRLNTNNIMCSFNITAITSTVFTTVGFLVNAASGVAFDIDWAVIG